LGPPALRAGLALAARTGGHPLVPHRAALPPKAARRLGRGLRARCRRVGAVPARRPLRCESGILPMLEHTKALALDCLRAGRLAEAEQLLQQILQAEPAHAEALGYLGGIRMAQGRYAEAEAAFQRVLQLRPEAIEIRNDLGVTQAQQGRPDQAVASFRRVLEA